MERYVTVHTLSVQVLTNPKYKENVHTLSVRMRDVIAKPVDTAVFWIHYAVRNKGVVQLKSHSMHLYWFQVNFVILLLALYDVFRAFKLFSFISCIST